MQILFDTNIVLDVLLNRQPWVTESAAIWQANDDGRIDGFFVASALTDIFYIARRLTDLENAHKAIRICLEAFQVCPVDRETLELAASLAGTDFEDNVQIACAQIANLDAIVTRDTDGFEATSISTLAPAELLAQLE